MLAGLAAFAVLGAFYLLCAGDTSLDEDVAAVVSAALAAVYAGLIRSLAGRRFALRAPWHRVVGEPLLQLLPDAWRVGGVLGRALIGAAPRGAMVRQPFRHGADDPPDAGRRALVTLAISLAPNGYAVDLAGEADTLLLHRLASAPAAADSEWPL